MREDSAGLGVNKKYGATRQGNGGGVYRTAGAGNEVVWQFDQFYQPDGNYRVPLAYKSVLGDATLLIDSSSQGVGGTFTLNVEDPDGNVLLTEGFSGGGTTTVTLATVVGPIFGPNELVYNLIPTGISDFTNFPDAVVKVKVSFENLNGKFDV